MNTPGLILVTATQDSVNGANHAAVGAPGCIISPNTPYSFGLVRESKTVNDARKLSKTLKRYTASPSTTSLLSSQFKTLIFLLSEKLHNAFRDLINLKIAKSFLTSATTHSTNSDKSSYASIMLVTIRMTSCMVTTTSTRTTKHFRFLSSNQSVAVRLLPSPRQS